jgi:glycosyltransferase involved in cell wall biosynthesis
LRHLPTSTDSATGPRIDRVPLPRTAVVVPAFNEAERIGDVLRAIRSAPLTLEILVVNDGSSDETAAVARSVDGVRVLDLPFNVGKGGAMIHGASATDAELVLFLDADLIGLQSAHVADLVLPVARGEVAMTVGVFRGGRLATDLSHLLVCYISGQRALRRDLFLSVPGIGESRSGVETAITRHVKSRRLTVRNVVMHGVTHPMKEEKMGLWRGARARLRMYWEIANALTHNGRAAGERKRDETFRTVPDEVRELGVGSRE